IGKTRGLNDFGKQVIREMNRLGMMFDVSHVSDKTFLDVVSTSTKPVVATHSACRAITNVPRNLTDDMIVALAKTGGVVNVIFYPEHIEPGYSEKKKKVDAEIASLVQRASDEEKGDAGHKKLARDRVRAQEYLKRLPPVSVSRIVDPRGVASRFNKLGIVPVRQRLTALVAAAKPQESMATRTYGRRPKIGFHAPIKNGLHESLLIAKETGCDAVQIFSRNPRGWK